MGGQQIIQIGNISGGQVSLGLGSSPQQPSRQPSLSIENHLAVVRERLGHLKAQVEAEAPSEKKDAALERLEELTEAITATAPDLDTIAYVKSWFAKNVPTLTEAVTAVVVHPSVSELMAAAGEAVATEFRRRFGRE